MKIHNFLWPDERIEYIARHAVNATLREYISWRQKQLAVNPAQSTAG